MYTARRNQLLGLLVAVSLVACNKQQPSITGETTQASNKAQSTDALQLASQQITADVLRNQIAKLSSDEFEGRGPATPGDTKTRDYLVDQLKQPGCAPGGPDGSYQQTFDIVGITADMPKQWPFKRANKAVSLKWWDQYIAASGTQTD